MDDVPSTIFRQPALWLGAVSSVLIAIGVGTQRAGPGVPSWWNLGLGAASLALLFGVAVATQRTHPPHASSWTIVRAIFARVFGTSLLMIGAGLIWYFIGPQQHGIIETLKGTCFMYGLVGAFGVLAIWVIIGLVKFVASMPSWSLDGWLGFVVFLLFIGLFVLLALTMGDKPPVGTSAVAGFIYIVMMLLGLNENSTMLLTTLAWGSIVGMAGCIWFVLRRVSAGTDEPVA